jgi:hypothetical protein
VASEKEIKTVLTSILAVLFDGTCALFLALYALLIGPLGILRGPLVIERFFLYLWVLVPLRALSRAVRAATDWRVGHFPLAIVQLDSIILQVLESYNRRPTTTKRRVLIDLYTVLTRAYLHVGDIDKAMQIILHAQKTIGVNRLTGLADLDAKTAHLIRAGIAAGRMLDGGGMATMFVKTEGKQTPTVVGGTSKQPTKNSKKPTKEKNGQVIPFPLR